MTDVERQEFDRAVAKAMVTLRFIAGHHRVCTACFCEAIIEELHGIAEVCDHGDYAEPLSLDEVCRIYDLDSIGEAQGSA